MDKQQQFNELFGKEPQFSEHRTGETIRFLERGIEKEGKILHVIPPGQAVEGGTPHGILYAVETRSKGFPSIVSPSDIIV